MLKTLWLVCSLLLPAGLFAQTKALVSDDFDSGQLDSKLRETRATGVATVQVQRAQVAHGKYALQVHYPEIAPASYALAVIPHLPESLKRHLFGRAYVKIVPGLPRSHTLMLWSGGAGWPISKFEETGVYQGTLQPAYQENKSRRGQGRGEDVRHGEALPTDKWFLLEWEFNDHPTTLTIWVDGQPSPVTENGQKADVSSFHWPRGSETAAGPVGGFEEFGIGARVWGAVPRGFDVYDDDLAIAASRIGPVK